MLCAADVVVPVPLHPSRERARGFNQARGIARHLGVRMTEPLRRTRKTEVQADLPAARRHRNVRGAFVVRRSVDVDGLVVVLVDDVCTQARRCRPAQPRCSLPERARSARSSWREPRRDSRDHVRRDRVLLALPIEPQPSALRCLSPVAVPDARKEDEIALVSVAIRDLASCGGLRRDVEQNREGRGGQVPLRVCRARSIEPLRLTVHDARRQIPVAQITTTPIGEPGRAESEASVRSGSRCTAAAGRRRRARVPHGARDESRAQSPSRRPGKSTRRAGSPPD